MIQRPTQQHPRGIGRAGTFVFVVLAVSGVACAGAGIGSGIDILGSAPGHGRPSSPVPARLGEEPVGAPAELDVARPGKAGELPNPLAYYQSHRDEFYRLTRSRGWLGWARHRTCTGPGCVGAQTYMSVEAIEDAHTVSFTYINGRSIIVGRLINRERYLDSRYPQCPATSSPTDYWPECYIVVGPEITVTGSDTSATQRLMILQFDANGDPASLSVQLLGTRYQACSPRHAPRAVSHADFTGCTMHAPLGGALQEQGVATPLEQALQSYATDSYNIKCPEGCCTG